MKTLEPSTWEERRVSLPLLGRRDGVSLPCREEQTVISLPLAGGETCVSLSFTWEHARHPLLLPGGDCLLILSPQGGTPGCISLPWDDSSHVSLCLGEKNVFIPPRGTLYLPSPPRWRLLLSLTLSPRGTLMDVSPPWGLNRGNAHT